MLDVILPDALGLELFRYAVKYSPNSVKIMLTGEPEIDMVVKSLNEGVDHFFLKPIEHDDLIHIVTNKIQRARKGRQRRS